jgi:hypothetical protein
MARLLPITIKTAPPLMLCAALYGGTELPGESKRRLDSIRQPGGSERSCSSNCCAAHSELPGSGEGALALPTRCWRNVLRAGSLAPLTGDLAYDETA